MPNLKVPDSISDTGWVLDEKTSLVNRGIRDYNRIVKFSGALSDIKLAEVVAWLTANNCPGCFGVSMRLMEEVGVYRFRTTWDSSD